MSNVSGSYDTIRNNDVCETLDCIANVYRIMGERQKALQFFEQSLKRRVRAMSAAAATTQADTAQISLLLSTYEDVLTLTKMQVKLCVNENEKRALSQRIGYLLMEMGSLYDQRLNKQSEALAYLQKALQVFQEIKDYQQIGHTLSNIGVIHVRNSDNLKALKCFSDSLVMRKMVSTPEEEDTDGIAETLHNIGNCEARDGQFEKSLQFYSEALQMKRRLYSNNQHLSIAKTEHCLGLAMLQLGDLAGALENFENSMKVRKRFLGDHLDVSFSLHR